MTAKIMIIIPTHNEAPNIKQTIDNILEHTKHAQAYQISILIMDSASTDNTASIVKDLCQSYPHLHLQQEPHKTGLGSAYYQAMHTALDKHQPDYIVENDADGSHHPAHLKTMIETCLQGADCAVGSRYIHNGSSKEWTFYRKMISQCANIVARIMLSFKYHDYTSGYRITCTKHLSKVLSRPFISKHYAYKIDLFWRLIQHGSSIVEIPIVFQNRSEGSSKLPRYAILDMLKVLLLLRLKAPTKHRRHHMKSNRR